MAQNSHGSDTRWGARTGDVVQAVAAAVGAAAACHLLWTAAVAKGDGQAAVVLESGLLVLVAALVTVLALARLRAEGALRDRTALLHAILDEAPEAIFVKDVHGRYVLLNRVAARIIGAPPEAILGRDDARFFPPDVAAALRATDRRAIEATAPLVVEEHLPAADGDDRTFLSTKSTWRDGSGRVAGLIGVAHDITARKRAEDERLLLLAHEREARDAAETAERRFLDLVDGLDAIVWEADAATLRFGFVSRRADELLGWPMEAWLEDREFWHRLVDPADRDRVLAARRAVAATGTSDDREYRVRTVEGEVRWFRDLAHAVHDDHGVIRQLRGVMFDVTARRRVEEQLRESESRFRLLADSTPSLIWMAGTDKACTWFNRQWLAFRGRTMAQEVGDGWMEGIHPDDLGRCLTTYHAAFDAREGFAQEYRMRRQDGAWRWVLDIGTPRLDQHGGFAGFVGSALDITERRAMEHELRVQRELAQQASRAKDEFLATVSHELRTPLAAVLGWARLLRTGSLPPAKAARALETIERAGRTQAQLIDDLLDISRIVTGRLRLEAHPVPVAPPVEAALDAVRPTAEARGVRLEAEIPPQATLVSGDPARLQQIVWNLLSNALKFTPRGGTVRCRVARTGPMVEVTVCDTGRGIAPEFLPHVFERFRQADGTSTRLHGGLGLGLAIVRHLVEMQGGTVDAQSPGPDQGATFRVVLPALDDVGAALPLDVRAAPAVDAASALRGRRVLVVDDDHDAREVLVAILESSGAEVRAASSVREALGTLEDGDADVVVSDIAMPGEDGFELIRRLRRHDAAHARTTPAVAVTAFARGEERRRILEAGFQLHLAKPVEPNELVSAIANLTGVA